MSVKSDIKKVRDKFKRYLCKDENRVAKLAEKVPGMALSEAGKMFSPMKPVSKEEVAAHLSEAWQDPEIPQRQYELFVKKQLEDYRNGQPLDVYDNIIDIIKSNIDIDESKRILEIGCSSGYYNEALKIKGVTAEYSGCDYSEVFIDFARKLYPDIDFQVQDARALTYPDGSFDIAVSGGCLLHIMDYEKAITETARVAKDYVIFHRTPVLHKKETSYFIKTAYGVKMFEIHFNERELLRLMKKNNLRLVDIITFNAAFEDSIGDFYAYKTYLCEKL